MKKIEAFGIFSENNNLLQESDGFLSIVMSEKKAQREIKISPFVSSNLGKKNKQIIKKVSIFYDNTSNA